MRVPDALACGSSCECPSSQQCDADAQCKPKGSINGPGVHPVCCADAACTPLGLVCENSDGSVGTCSGGVCSPLSCSALGQECGEFDDGCGGTVGCGDCKQGMNCVQGKCAGVCNPNCFGKQCGDDGCDGSCGECPPGWNCLTNGQCSPCTPDCAGKQCGDDGCGATCGTCPPGQTCEPNGSCGGCTPNCAGKECGDDGCGGNCGTCGFEQECVNGLCGCKPSCLNKECGDNGCGGVCGSCGFEFFCSAAGICTPEDEPTPMVDTGPDALPAISDAGATDGRLASGPDQVGSVNWDTGYVCPAGTNLRYGRCIARRDPTETEQKGESGGCAIPAGQTGCGGLLLLILLLMFLRAVARPPLVSRIAVLIPALVLLGGACSETELLGEWWDMPPRQMPKDVTPRNTDDDNGYVGPCVPDCDSRECGDDGCGGSCGACPEGVDCAGYKCTGTCEDECSPPAARTCEGNAFMICGQHDADGCMEWGEPVMCPGAGFCADGECQCTSNCSGKACGYDGCMGSCGTCPVGQTCSQYVCMEGCVNECDTPGESICSGDGRVVCGQYDADECMEWGELLPCTGQCVGGQCSCTANCSGKQCGDDGCGGSCGNCVSGKVCVGGNCVENAGGDCVAGQQEELPCGQCGKQVRNCQADGTFGPWSECVGQGICAPGTSENQACDSCGTQNRNCNVDCLWDPWGKCTGEGVCKPGELGTQQCGNCGSQSRTCSSNCQWGAWESCMGSGVCSMGEQQQQQCGLCGTETRTCAASCTWGPWAGCSGAGECTPGQSQSQNCGNCGTQNRTCDGNCNWSGWGACSGQGQCSPGQNQPCGNCGNMSCGPSCQWGSCSGGGPCAAGTVSTDGCPTCRAKTCNNQCNWNANCNQCSGCNTFTQCGMSCPSGYHPTNYGCSFSCGSSCWSNNQVTCQPNCGNSFTSCGMSCPSGYHPTNYGCSFSCGSNCWSNNQVTCVSD